jgi:hypothetical protein
MTLNRVQKTNYFYDKSIKNKLVSRRGCLGKNLTNQGPRIKTVPTFGLLELIPTNIGCSFKFILKVSVEESIVNAPRITDHSYLDLTALFALFVFLLCILTSGAFTIDFSTPPFRRNLNEHPIQRLL